MLGQIECPDLLPIGTRSGDSAWVMMYGEDRGGPGDHGGTLAAAGWFDGVTFTEWAPPDLVDCGPDFYAAQSFHGLASGDDPIVLAWMNSWHYSRVHPSRGRRGVLSVPRTLSVVSPLDPRVRSAPAPPVVAGAEPVAGPTWRSTPDGAVMARGTEFHLTVDGGRGPVAEVIAGDRAVRLVRPDEGLDLDRFAIDLVASTGGETTVVVDHGTVEVFTAAGRTLSALIFPGADWTVTVEGDAALAAISGGSR